MNEFARKLSQFLTRPDAERDFRIQQGTEMYRKGFCRFELKDENGNPVKAAQIRVRQTGHEFLFGCNAFMLNQFPEKAQNEQYEETFAAIFNEAVIPFYWSDLEPEEGVVRFAAGSKPAIYRRPPPDEVVAFCQKYGITPKGHPLCWHQFSPEWAPKDPALYMRRLDQRMREIAARYADKIFLWDCVNEAQTRDPLTRAVVPALPQDHVEQAFRMADRYFAAGRLLYNDDSRWWDYQGDYSPVYLLVSRLLEHGCRVGGLGLQYHMFDGQIEQYAAFMNPRFIYTALDQFAKLQIPVNFSEVSIISRRDLGDGDAFQELVAEKLYRIWFSHPAVEGITWWNLVDGTAAYAPLGSEEGENRLRAGLVNYDFTPKPVFRALQRLIKEEWHTETALDYSEGGDNVFRGFYGQYEAEIRTDAGTFRRTFGFTKNSTHKVGFTLKPEDRS